MKKRFFLCVFSIALIAIGAIVLFSIWRISAQKENKTVVIEYWTHSDPARNTLEEILIKEFETNNPNVKVNRTIYTSSELLNVLPNAISAGRGPDVLNLQQDYLGPIIEDGYLSPVDPEALGYPNVEAVLDRYTENAFYGATKDGQIYGIPMEFTNWCLYINKALFREAGLDAELDYPKTWEDMVDICELLVSREDGILTQRGFDFRYPHFLTFFVPMVQQLGGNIQNEAGELEIIGEAAWEKAFAFMLEWGPLGKNLGSPTYINARTVFNDGDIAMMLSGLYHEERLRYANPELYESGEWMVVPFPVFEGGFDVSAAMYCHYWGVNNSSSEDEQKAAWSFIGHLSNHSEDYLTSAYLIAPKKDVIENLDSYNIPYISVFRNDLEKSSFVYSGPEVSEIREVLETLIKEVMLLGLDPEKAVIRLKMAIQELSL